MNSIIFQALLNNKSILLFKVQPLQHRQSIGFGRKIKRKFLRSQTFAFNKILRKQIFRKRTQYNIIRQIISIFSFNNRINSQRVHPSRILSHTFLPTGNNQRVIKSQRFALLAERKILIGIHQTKDTVFSRSNPPDYKMSATVRTGYPVKRQFSKCRIG